MAKDTIISFFKKPFMIARNVAKEEISEIKDITPTDEDYKQGQAMAVIAIAALSSMGIPVAGLAEPIIAKVFAYGIRDVKDGVENNDKLIISRVIEEVRKAH